MTSIAALTMYDLPELRAATDDWWTLIARHFHRVGIADVPKTLSRDVPVENIWRNPSLLVTQTCGYPLTHAFADVLTAVAVPDYRAPECGGGAYRSAFVVRETDPAGSLSDFRRRTAAANGPDSQSGCNVLRSAIAPLARNGHFFDEVLWTGSHRASLAAVREGRAGIAAVDGVTLALIRRVAPAEADGLRVLSWSVSTPALPYATRTTMSDDMKNRIRDGLLSAATDPDGAAARDTLIIDGLSPIADEDYSVMETMRDQAERQGYPELR